MNPTVSRFLGLLLPSLAVATAGTLLLAVVAQQGLRQEADDPQHQLVEDAAASLNAGATPSAIVAGTTVEISVSLAPFLAVYDRLGHVLAANGQVDGQAPIPPLGVLNAARQNGIDTVTWQPRAGVRIAAVALPWAGGTVLAGRSLRRVESVESALQGIALLGYLALVLAVALASAVAAKLWPASHRASPPSAP